ncbi:MAG: hypothetical protein JOY96_04885 [Verrucomicrobia bacterium]|nr:hypothetical protein [Verrucomicrobiota bacterium]MBV9671255.1 hypothetical protein [Verrucomicrobiota bacterium]
MSDLVGGYILFPPTLSRTDLITGTLQAMELVPDEFEVRLPEEDGLPRLPEDGFPFRTEQPPEYALTLLAQEESGVIKGKGSKSSETFWFEPKIASYPVVNIWVVDTAMYYNEWPKDIEHFVERWLRLCEQGQAVFGYFSQFEHMFDREYLEDQIFPALQHEDLPQLLVAEVNWLIYLGPELAERWRQEQPPFPSPPLISQDLPSGAHFFRTKTSVFD